MVTTTTREGDDMEMTEAYPPGHHSKTISIYRPSSALEHPSQTSRFPTRTRTRTRSPKLRPRTRTRILSGRKHKHNNNIHRPRHVPTLGIHRPTRETPRNPNRRVARAPLRDTFRGGDTPYEPPDEDDEDGDDGMGEQGMELTDAVQRLMAVPTVSQFRGRDGEPRRRRGRLSASP